MKADKLLGTFALLMVTVILLMGAAGGDCAGPARAGAQAPVRELTPTLALARTFVREAGTRSYSRDDGPAIHAVISFLAEHIYRTDYLSAIMRATNGAPTRRSAPRPWITQLWPSNARPELWPGHLSWRRGSRQWHRTYQQAVDVRRGDIEHRCRMPGSINDVSATPHAWGSEHDSIRFRREHPEAVELDCGQTCTLESDGRVRLTRDGLPRCNHFFHLPRYELRFGGEV
ncbi:MAG TPA: hypothetical protein ENK57_12145 [Polyangiaceae bacterium]|nr:hypothetical protein [Polyangiaceae bacterium]